MPGSRLTVEDRRLIAAGLAEGLGYAEIARRLGRPTSTVSREVSRNGGFRGYRAEHAHEAASRRARRIRAPLTDRRGSAPAREFEERFTETMVATGLPRMPARVLVRVLVEDEGGLSAGELIRRLGVSPASVSKAVAYLERIGLIRREREQGDRRERYVIDDDIWYLACLREVQVCTTWAEAARLGTDLLDGTPAGTRLGEMSRYFEHVGQDLAASAEHWRQVFTPRDRSA